MDEEYSKILNSISDEDKTNLIKILDDYAFEKRKEKLVDEVSAKNITTFINSVEFLSNVEDNELEAIKNQNEFQQIYNLLVESKNSSKIHPKLLELYKKNIATLSRILKIKRARIKYKILGKQISNYKYLSKHHKDKAQQIFETCLKKANPDQKEYLRLIDMDINFCDNDFYLINLTESVLNIKTNHRDILESIAFSIVKPEHQLVSYFQYYDCWESFPLKWFIMRIPIDQAKTVFYYHKNGLNLIKLIEDSYSAEDFKLLLESLDYPYINLSSFNIIGDYKGPINEAIQCFRNSKYVSSLLTLFPIIEGIIWNFSYSIHKKKIQLFTDASLQKLISIDGKEIDKSIGNLFKNTSFKYLIDFKFIDYFCDEFYAERNPKLHGEGLSNINSGDVIKKILTLDYVLDLAKTTMKETIHGFIKSAEIDNKTN